MFVHLCLASAYMHQSVSIHYGEKIPAKNAHDKWKDEQK